MAAEASNQLRNRAGLEGALARPATMPTIRMQTLHSQLLPWRTGSLSASSSSMAVSAS
jgi:hypothetical protein